MPNRLNLNVKIYILYISYYSYKHIGYTLQNINPKLSKTYYEKALSCAELLYKKPHKNLAEIYRELGNICRKSGEWKEATKYLGKALIVYELTLPNSPELSKVSIALGNLAWDMDLGEDDNHLKDAVYYYRKALSIDKKLENYVDIARDNNNLGLIKKELLEYHSAMRHFEKAKRLYCEHVGASSSEVALTYLNMVEVLIKLNRVEEAQGYAQFALNIYEKFYKEDYRKIGLCHDALGLCHFENGDYKKAMECHKKALDAYRMLYEKDHVLVANSYFLIGKATNEDGDLISAKSNCLKALGIIKTIAGTNGCKLKGDITEIQEYLDKLNGD